MCRSFLTPDKEGLNPDGSHKYYGRFNFGVYTLNLPYIACLADGKIDEFWKLMDKYTELAHKALRCRYEHLKNTPSDIAPILWQHGAMARLQPGEKIEKLLRNNYATVSLGYAGIYETVYRLIGKSHTATDEGHDLAINIMQFMNDKCAKWRAEEGISYSVYGTPRLSWAA